MLIDMYANFGLLDTAQVVFDHVLARSIVCWNAIIRGYIDHVYAMEMLYCL